MNGKERIELSISSSYLEHWTIYDALRELFQNSFDRSKEDETTGWFKDVEPSDSGYINLQPSTYERISEVINKKEYSEIYRMEHV